MPSNFRSSRESSQTTTNRSLTSEEKILLARARLIGNYEAPSSPTRPRNQKVGSVNMMTIGSQHYPNATASNTDTGQARGGGESNDLPVGEGTLRARFSTRPRNQKISTVNMITTSPHHNPHTISSSTDTEQVKGGRESNILPIGESTLRSRLSMAKSHLDILQTLLRYGEYDDTTVNIKDKIKRQQAKVEDLEEQLNAVMPKEKKATSTGSQFRDTFRKYRNRGS
jgi:hypothetical protein